MRNEDYYIGTRRAGAFQIFAVAAFLLFGLSIPVPAGKPLTFLKKVGTLIDTLSVSGLDRRYIDKPDKPWQIIVKGNVNQSDLKMNTTNDLLGLKTTFDPRLKTEPAYYVGVWAGYRGYGLGYTINVAGDKGSYFTLGAMGGAYGINLRIHTFKNDAPDIEMNSENEELIPSIKDQVKLKDPIKVRTVIADGYYMFNGKRFSYAAAYDQSVIQKRSAGSLMAGAMYYYSNTDFATDANGPIIYMMDGLGRVKLWQGSIGVGYAYNWVPVKGLLVSAMAMPMLTFVNQIRLYSYTTNFLELALDPAGDALEGDEFDKWLYDNSRIEEKEYNTYNGGLAVNFDARLSLTYNFNRYFINAYGQFCNFRYRHDESHGYLNDWFVNASFGVRL